MEHAYSCSVRYLSYVAFRLQRKYLDRSETQKAYYKFINAYEFYIQGSVQSEK